MKNNKNTSYEQTLPYNSKEKKETQIAKMFDSIAPKYDNFNRMMSFGLDILWRKKAIKSLMHEKTDSILDIATGTGDFALQAFQTLNVKKITGIDISTEMMKVAEEKVKEKGLQESFSFQEQNSEAMSFPEQSFDAITVAFGIRNFGQLEKKLKEMHRVLKTNGNLVILELSEPSFLPFRWLYKLHAYIIIPFLGRLFSSDKHAYQYLPKSISVFPQGEKMIQILESSGFQKIEYQTFSLGVCSFYKAKKF